MSEAFDLDRFIDAQEQVYPGALQEIRNGAKRSHWMWFVFPQHVALGRSPMAARYGIRSVDEARAYLAHPVLGARLRECVNAVLNLAETDVVRVFGSTDAMKLRSSLTLFEAAGGGVAFGEALERWYRGERDEATLALI